MNIGRLDGEAGGDVVADHVQLSRLFLCKDLARMNLRGQPRSEKLAGRLAKGPHDHPPPGSLRRLQPQVMLSRRSLISLLKQAHSTHNVRSFVE
ncbi:MAG TPA: hypothetical protein VGS41_15045, partial [Chthonomonadales bacterium]|nr:hypothetical protein [Chthonomonadales bacterium]